MGALLKSNERLFREALHTRGLKIVVGTDAVIARIELGQPAMDAR